MSTATIRQRRRKTSKEERMCTICFQAFKKAEHLARHFRSHTKEKPFRCHVCGRKYTRQDTLLRHSRSHQTSDQDVSGEGVVVQEENAQDTSHLAESVTLPMEISNIYAQDTPNTSVGVGSATNISHPIATPPTSTLFSTDSGESVVNQAAGLQPSIWDPSIDPGWASWFTGDDFDLDAVNLSLLQASSDTAVQTIHNVPNQNTAAFSVDPTFHIDESRPDLQFSIRCKWHTYSELVPSGYITPTSSQRPVPIDDTYRKRLAENLRQNVQHGILPSTSFLNLCIQAYFAHFHPIFPIIHAPSFRPSTRNSVLLLSICSMGSLFLGSPRATAHGISMFERLNKAILASWDTYVLKRDLPCLIALQASVIGQTFGLLVGRPKDLAGIEVFHGSVIAWARMAKLFQEETLEFNLMDLDDGEALQEAWKTWIFAEEKKRIVLSIYVHDAELAKLRHHEPMLRHSVNRLPRIASNKHFAASTAEEWKALMLESRIEELASSTSAAEDCNGNRNGVRFAEINTDFERSVILESISALAYETRNPETAEQCRCLLMSWYEQNQEQLLKNRHKAGLMILWHSIFLVVHADLDALERACGRDGEDVSWKANGYAQEWANSADGIRCILHAVQIQNLFETIPVGAEPPIHVPMCLYHCGIVWFCFSRFAQRGTTRLGGDDCKFPEMPLLGIDRSDGEMRNMMLEDSGGLQAGRAGLNKVFTVIDLLQRISHWKIAHSFATTLLAIVEAEQDIF